MRRTRWGSRMVSWTLCNDLQSVTFRDAPWLWLSTVCLMEAVASDPHHSHLAPGTEAPPPDYSTLEGSIDTGFRSGVRSQMRGCVRVEESQTCSTFDHAVNTFLSRRYFLSPTTTSCCSFNTELSSYDYAPVQPRRYPNNTNTNQSFLDLLCCQRSHL
jgi:hypothetical protein